MTAMMVRFLNTLISLRHKMLGGGLLLGILGGGVQPGSPNPDPISD